MTFATTAKGTEVYIAFVDDVEPNEGGYYCEVWDSEDMLELIDYFCIHPDDCDCEDDNAVEEYAKNYISNITEY